MRFGLCNAPNTFQRLINMIFEKEINLFVLVYLDDILIYNRPIGEHWDHLKIALDNCVGLNYLDGCISASSRRMKWITSDSRSASKGFAFHLER